MIGADPPERPADSGPTSGARYRLLPVDRPADDVEQEILERWTRENLFHRTLAQTERGARYVFFEGPPTANGRPGIHHVFSRTIKDLFCRHRAMRGFYVQRKAGWDTHGLPVEIEVERQLGISGKQQIEEIGVERFNQLCRESVFTYRDEWQRLSERIAFWLDYEDAYVTFSNDYIESVWWALKTLYDRELLYLGHKILPYCPRCGTALSSHEVAQGYETVRDPSVYVALPLADDPNRRMLVWTTTPWTLVSNVALAVHPELAYVEFKPRKGDARTVILAAARAAAVLGDDYTDRWEKIREIRGSDLAWARYRRPLEWVGFERGEHEVIVAEDFVSAEDGTGVVHMAPAFGADDYASAQRHGLAFVQPVDSRGRFAGDVPEVAGMLVKDADAVIVEKLRERGVLWRAGTIEHSYPHCWRCETPLLYYARNSWFVRTTTFRDQMLARNARVNWQPPEVGSGRFGEWLSNNIDWAISRDRYWGTPLPIWICDRDPAHRDAIGSYAELTERSGRPLSAQFDPHKPYVDDYIWRCHTCSGTMRRVPEVIDAWFDSGSMPFAQWHYPFENVEQTERQYPADFIAEGVDQTRGWFYSLLAIATGLGGGLPNNVLAHEQAGGVETAPYRAAVVNDLLLDSEGQKMSKSRGNVIDPWQLIERHGADAVRLSLVAVSQVWIPRRFDEAVIREHAVRFLVTLKNVYSGIFALYANFGWAPSDADPAPGNRPHIDRWALSRLATVEREVNQLLERYEPTLAARAVSTFLVDDVANWYVRLNRHRFYDVDDVENRAAFATLREVLAVTCRLLAPFAPFVSDWIHRELTGESVHLVPYVRQRPTPSDPVLEQGMEAIRTLARLGRAAREDAGIRVRQPLERLVCVIPDNTRESADALLGLLSAELNVKRVELASSSDTLVRLEARPNFRVLGKRFGKNTPIAAAAVAALDDASLRALERGERVFVTVQNETHALTADEVTIIRRAAGGLVVKEEGEFFAAIDPTVTPELRNEGLARELVSRVQRLRKESGFAVSDRIRLVVWGDPEVESAARAFSAWIAEEVLARELAVGEPSEADGSAHEVEIDGRVVWITVRRME